MGFFLEIIVYRYNLTINVMKRTLYPLLLLIVCGLGLPSCTDDTPQVLEKVRFTVNVGTNGDDGGRIAEGAQPSKLILSLESENGTSIFSFEEIDIYTFGDQYITEPVALASARYRITDFLLVDDDGEVIYAAPKIGSPLAKAVNHPVPYHFYVNKNKVITVDMEVISSANQSAQDFGYASFKITPVNPFKLGVFLADHPNQLTTADAYIIHNDDTIKQVSLKAEINLFSFQGDPDDSYTLVVRRTGYSSHMQTFNYADLINTLNGAPLTVILHPAQLTMLAYVSEGSSNYFYITLRGNAGTLHVSWGDGTSENVDPGSSYYNYELEHTYPAQGNYSVVISGDVEPIHYFYSFYGQGMIDEIDLSALVNLTEIRFGLTRGPHVLDLSNNHKLVNLLLSGQDNMEQLILPQNNVIEWLDIAGNTSLSTAELDNIVNAIHASVVLTGRTNGALGIATNWYDSGDLALLPFSAAAILKLQELRDSYGWQLYPEEVITF